MIRHSLPEVDVAQGAVIMRAGDLGRCGVARDIRTQGDFATCGAVFNRCTRSALS
jgi:hypothetical protein